MRVEEGGGIALRARSQQTPGGTGSLLHSVPKV